MGEVAVYDPADDRRWWDRLVSDLDDDRCRGPWREVLPPRYHGARFGRLSGEVEEVVREWFASETPRNLLLVGTVGVGKTYASALVAKSGCHFGWRTMFRAVPDLLTELRPSDGDATLPARTMHRAMTSRLLVLDELGAEKTSEFTVNELNRLLNHRWNHLLPTVVTSNLDPRAKADEERRAATERRPPRLAEDDPVRSVGERGWSRLKGGAVALRIAGADRRQGAAA